MPRKTAAPKDPDAVITADGKVFDLTTIERIPRYIWREIEREDQDPLRVKLRDLSVGQTNDIPVTNKTPLSETFQVIAPYVVEWTLEALDTVSGETIPVPPPAEVGWEVFELLDAREAGDIISWLKYPQQMRTLTEKKLSSGSGTTPSPPKPAS